MTAWAQTLTDETAELWRSLKGQYDDWASGFDVFYSPVPERAGLLVIGENPAGSDRAFDIDRASRIPVEHSYFSSEWDYALAKKMRALFAAAGKTEALQKSVKLNLNFFRSKDRESWDAIGWRPKRAMEDHSKSGVLLAIERLEPSVVVCEGTTRAFDPLCEPLGVTRKSVLSKVMWKGSPARGYVRATGARGTLLIGLIHPTGCSPAFDGAREQFASFLKADLAGV